jgi:hypothetical protein
VVDVDEAARMALDLPQVTEHERHGNRTWFVAGKAFAWERPFSKADVRRFGDTTPPEGPILAVRVADLGEKEAVLAAQPGSFFTIPHFDGYAAVLVELRTVTGRALEEAIVDAWLACAGEAGRRARRRGGGGSPAVRLVASPGAGTTGRENRPRRENGRGGRGQNVGQ